MINLITGRPGHAKNIYALKWLEDKKFIHHNKTKEEDYFVTVDDERPVYFVGFDGIKVSGAEIADYKDLDKLPRLQSETNESIFNDGAVIVIDEAHVYCGKSQNKDGFTGFVSFLKIHRHLGFDFVFITQSPADLNIDIRALVDVHYRVVRPFGAKQSFVTKFNGCETKQNPKPVQVFNKKFKIDERYFNIYKSASTHNFKTDIPKKYYIYFFLFICFIGFVIYQGTNAYDFFTSVGNSDSGFIKKTTNNLSGPAAGKKRSGSESDFERFHVSIDRANSNSVFFYRFKYPEVIAPNIELLKQIHLSSVIDTNSLYCYCSKDIIKAYTAILELIDVSDKVEVTFHLVSFDDADFDNFNLNYSFLSSHFSINGGDILSNNFLFTYLKRDFSSYTRSSSSSIVNLGYDFDASFLTDYPRILRSFDNSLEGESVTKEKVVKTSVGHSFKIKTRLISNDLVKFELDQSHSDFKGVFIDDIPVVSDNSFLSTFDLKPDVIVPLFSINALIDKTEVKSSIPFLGFLFPDNKDYQKENYRFFFSFRFLDDDKKTNYDSSVYLLKKDFERLPPEKQLEVQKNVDKLRK